MAFTKVWNDQQQQYDVQFPAHLVSVSDQILQNVNGTEYRVGTIEFENAKGNSVRRSAMIYENNYQYGMTPGETYLATGKQTEQGVLVTLSHLQGAARPQEDDFEGVFEDQPAEETTAKADQQLTAEQ